MIKLNKKDLNGECVVLSPSYISNGHWAIKLDIVENAALFQTEESTQAFANIGTFRLETDDFVEKVFPKKRSMKVTSVGKILNSSLDLDPRRDNVVFADDKGTEVCFKRYYFKLLGLAEVELFGEKADGPFTNADRTIVLMPVRP